MLRRISTALFLTFLAGVGAGCAQPVMSVWVAGEMTSLTDRTPPRHDPEAYNKLEETVLLHAGANETTAFQLVIDIPPEQERAMPDWWPGENEPVGVSGLSVEVTDLRTGSGQRIDASNIRAFRMLPVKLTDFPAWYLRLTKEQPKPAEVYDPLIPLDASDAPDLSGGPGQRIALWVDVTSPRTALPGRYFGKLRLRSGGQTVWETRIRLDVHDFILPDARPIPVVGGFDYRDVFAQFLKYEDEPFVPTHLNPRRPLVREGLTLVRDLMRMAHRHRLDLFEKGLRPVLKRDRNGNVQLQWDQYDAIVKPYLDGSAFAPEDRIGCPAWPMPAWTDWPDPETYRLAGDDVYQETFRQVARQTAAHFRQLGYGDRLFAWPYRGPITQGAYDRQLVLSRMVRQGDANVPILSQLPLDPPPETTWTPPRSFANLVDIHAPQPQWLDPTVPPPISRRAGKLAGMWLSPGQQPYLPSLGVIATSADARALPWLAMRYEAAGILLPEVLHWTTSAVPSEAQAQTRLFYPGTIGGVRRVVPSVRLKRLRRGLQDISYLWILQRRGRDAAARGVIRSMVRYAGLAAAGDHYLDPRLDGWEQDVYNWQLARRVLAGEIVAALHPDRVTERDRDVQQLRWNELLARTRDVRLERVRTELRPVLRKGPRGQDEPWFYATIYVDLYNQLGRDVPCTLRAEHFPPSWKPIDRETRVELPAQTRTVVALAAEGRTMPVALTGKIPFTVLISPQRLEPRRVRVDVPVLRATRVDQGPTVDGDLSDWPLGQANRAGDFRLLGRRGRTPQGLAKYQTRAYVLADPNHLHLAIRCFEPDPNTLQTRATNDVRHEQLLATGEDLVEIVLDPLSQATRPEDLYHLVVKANGALTATRGIETHPPLGKSEPWVSRAKVAVQRGKGQWTVEITLPRSSLGKLGGSGLWGINFARFRPANEEASNWAGALRYYYDPRNLGAMFIP